ncbi:MAG: energy-coupled thiamine transporter ThiT [Oscillospiraceae bacterium]|nr:energy-coupled thiamine transporter ThiT [Oscillospiraceae bacterium]
MKNPKRRTLLSLCEGAIMVALAQVLGYLKIWQMPNGGSVTFVMLPIFVYCVRWGFGRGMLAAFALSVLQFLLDGGMALGWQSIIGDYLLAYSVLGLAGLFSKAKGGFFWGTLVGSFARFLVAWVVGATIWAEYMPESFFGMTMTTPWLYSLLYNGSYILLSMALCLAVGAVVYKPLGKFLKRVE